MTDLEVLSADRVVLRPFRADDARDLALGCDDPLTQRFLPLLPSPYTLEDARWWITDGARQACADGGAAYAVADPHSDRLIGGAGVGRPRDGTAELGYWVAPWARRRGVATAAARRLADAAFTTGVERLELRTDPVNGPSQRVAIAAGFAREAVLRGAGRRRGGERYDQIMWARLSTDPAGPSHRLLPDLPGGELSDGVVALRPLRADDVEDSYALNIVPDVVATSMRSRPNQRADIERRCAIAEAGWLAGQRGDLTIRDAATGSYAGEIGLYYWEPQSQQAMIGYSMMPAWRGRGYATRAARLVAAWAFEHVGIVRLIAGTQPSNLASQHVLERAGFVREGYQRARLPGPDGTRIDDLLYARTALDSQPAAAVAEPPPGP